MGSLIMISVDRTPRNSLRSPHNNFSMTRIHHHFDFQIVTNFDIIYFRLIKLTPLSAFIAYISFMKALYYVVHENRGRRGQPTLHIFSVVAAGWLSLKSLEDLVGLQAIVS